MAEALPIWSIVDTDGTTHTIITTKKLGGGKQGVVFEATMADKHILVKQLHIIKDTVISVLREKKYSIKNLDNIILERLKQRAFLRQQFDVEVDVVRTLNACGAVPSGFTCFRGIAAPEDFIKSLPADRCTSCYISDETLLLYDILPGKDLFKYIAEDQDNKIPILTDYKKISIIRQLLQILVKQAENDIISRDIKLENLMYNHETDVLKIIDYGFGCKRATCDLTTFQGSPGYIAPEIYKFMVSREDALAIDIFAAGMVIFTLLHTWTYFGVHAFAISRPLTDAFIEISTKTGAYYGQTTKDYLNTYFTKTAITETTLPLILAMINPNSNERPIASAALAQFNESYPVAAAAVGGRRTRSRRRRQRNISTRRRNKN